MVLCKYFLQGTCRFGTSCKFDHEINDLNAVSILRQPQSQPQPQQSNDANVAILAVANDMLAAEKGGQWLLSCYAPFKGKQAFPGFQDSSFEEVRWGFYSARKSGNLEQYQRQLRNAMQEAAMRMKALQNPTPDVANVIKTLFNSPLVEAATNKTTVSGAAPNTFSFAEASRSIFAQKPPATTSTGSIFAQASQALFGNKPANVFQASAFQPQQHPNAFQAQQQPNVFHTQQPQWPASTSMNVAEPSVFQVANTQSSIFGGSAFSSSSGRSAVSFGKTESRDDSAYSKAEDLSESERKAFEADSFEFGKIPEKPPTAEMCF